MVKKKTPQNTSGEKSSHTQSTKFGGNKNDPELLPPPQGIPKSQKFKFSFLFHVFSSTDLATKKGREKPNYLFGVNHEVGGIMVAMSGSTESLGSGEEDSGLASCSSCCAIPIYNKVI